MRSPLLGDDQPPGLSAFCTARESVDAATTILVNLLDEDRLYLMKQRESRKLLEHTRRLLELASESLAGG